jgi:hypothetical protein
MSQQITIILTDDLDPTGETEAAGTHTFSLDGDEYEIDLSDHNYTKLRTQLAEFMRAGRAIKRQSKRPARAMTEPAGRGATLNRHQGGIDPKATRAWARQQGLDVPPRGRIPKKIKDAYRSFDKFGDRSRLDALLNEQEGRLDPGTPEFAVPQSDVQEALKAAREKAAEAPRRPLSATRTEDATPTQEPAGEEEADPAEKEAREHYVPNTQHSNLDEGFEDSRAWKGRTASGHKVEQLSLVERIELLTPFNLAVLGRMAAGTRNKDGNISGLATSDIRLENLEMIQAAPGTRDGWCLTKLGEYAYKVRNESTK